MFNLKKNNTNIKTEILAGITTFLTMAYVLFVHPNMLSNTGMDKGALITVTALVSSISCFAVAFFANSPIAMAPGMGLNAFFTFSLCLSENIPWQTSLGIVFLSGLVFLLLTVFGTREKIMNAIPEPIKSSISIGIGLFIAFIGFQGMGLIVHNDATLISLGKWNIQNIIGIFGLFITIFLLLIKVRGAILIGIVVSTIVAIILKQTQIPSYFVSYPPSIMPIAFKLDILGALKISFIVPILTFMYMDLFDSIGTILAVSDEGKLIDRDKNPKNIKKILMVDASATMFGAIFGTSTTTSYMESAAGIAEGGKTGLTAFVIGIFFLLSMFFSPLISIVPYFAVAPALVIVGIFMMKSINKIDFQNLEYAIPAFFTILMMPLSYSISTGISFGFISYVLIKIFKLQFKDLNFLIILIFILSIFNLVF
jgi:adenine/guanine/hypoxanthine permease